MEGKNRTILVVLTALVIAVAVFSSFGMNLIPPQTATLTRPKPVPSASLEPVESPVGGASLPQVEVTPETVQEIVATLTRPERYYREITVTYSGVDTPTVSKVWAEGGWTRTDTTRPNGIVQHTLVGEGMCYYWYQNSRTWLSAPADEKSADLDGPRIPTYEDVLLLDQSTITDAGYVDRDGLDCLFLTWTGETPEEVHTYYISVEPDSLGLLAEAQLQQGGRTVLAMEATAAQQPEIEASTFLLPDGTDPRTGDA